MPTIIVIFAIFIVMAFIIGYDKYKKAAFIAKAIDGSLDSRFITNETQMVIDQLKQPKLLRVIKYSNSIRLPDSQEIAYDTSSMDMFQRKSQLHYEPTKVEWEILRGIVKKIYQTGI